jgi:multicomponent Na+:H+ antiporter subunit F
MFETLLMIALFLLALCAIGGVYRLVKGPSIPDRVIALDMIGINLIGIIAIVSVLLHTEVFFEVILLLGALAFIGTVAFSKFLEKGVIIDHDRNR